MEQFMTSEEIAQLLRVDPVTIRRLVNKGELSAYRIGARLPLCTIRSSGLSPAAAYCCSCAKQIRY